MKNNIEYYQHFANSHLHPKFKMLRIKYGWEGEGKFWALNNMIASSDGCQLDLSRKFIVADILELFQMTYEEFIDFVDYLVKECELLLREEKIITTATVQENHKTLTIFKKKNQEKYERRKRLKDLSGENEDLPDENKFYSGENENYPSENLQRKGKKIKVNKIKEERRKEQNSSANFIFIKNLYLSRTRIKDPHSETQIKPIAKYFESIPEVMTRKHVGVCITQAFDELPKDKGIRVEYLCSNIQKKITVLTEQILAEEKIKTAEDTSRFFSADGSMSFKRKNRVEGTESILKEINCIN